jgi:plastocyanin
MPVINTFLTRFRIANYKDPKVLSILALSFLIIAGLLALLLVKKPFISKTPTITPIARVTITKDGFIPATMSVKRETKVVWTNSDTKIHQIQANPFPSGDSLPSLKSEILNIDQHYQFVANKIFRGANFGLYGYILKNLHER